MGIAYIVVQLNEFLGLATIVVLFLYRLVRYEAQVCSGDHP